MKQTPLPFPLGVGRGGGKITSSWDLWMVCSSWEHPETVAGFFFHQYSSSQLSLMVLLYQENNIARESPCCSVWWTKSMFPSPISVNYFWIMSLSIFFFCIHYYPFFLWQVVSIHSFTGPRKIPKVVWKMSLPDFMRRCWQKIGN